MVKSIHSGGSRVGEGGGGEGQSKSDDVFVSAVKAKELLITSILNFLFQWKNRCVDVFTIDSLIFSIQNKIPSDLFCPTIP